LFQLAVSAEAGQQMSARALRCLCSGPKTMLNANACSTFNAKQMQTLIRYCSRGS
jgi:hypothetical protein